MREATVGPPSVPGPPDMPEPSYGDVCTGATGHTEALEVEFDPERVRYDDLLEGKIHDPTPARPSEAGRRSVIFIHSPEQEAAAPASKERAQARFSKPIVTEIEPASEFYPAEGSHQRRQAPVGPFQHTGIKS